MAVLVLCGTACKKGYDQSQMAKLTASEQAIVGNYELKTEFVSAQPGATSAEMKDLIEMMTMLEGGATRLECLPDKTFVLSAGETPVRGVWTLDKAHLRLRIDKVGDMKPDQIAKVELANKGISGFNMSPEQRQEFLSAYRNSVALERAESVAKLRVAADGTLYAETNQSDSIFGNMVNYFTKQAKK